MEIGLEMDAGFQVRQKHKWVLFIYEERTEKDYVLLNSHLVELTQSELLADLPLYLFHVIDTPLHAGL